MTQHPMTVVLGASHKPDRYSYKALHKLQDHGLPAVGVHPKLSNFDGFSIYPSLTSAHAEVGPIDTVTVYVSADRSSALTQELIQIHPRRVIFNPGAENHLLETELKDAGIEVIEACTLVLLSTGQY
ncbi:MAG: CoA-binding protein [Bdellovibrionales bacterium]|nr:CoA-binding protein [Bdellovibrionales bacterium]